MADHKDSGNNRRREPVAARALQFAILMAAVALLFSLILPRTWPLIVTGALIIASSLPPLLPYVNRWFVGAADGREADQVRLIRLGVGGVLILASTVQLLTG